MMNWKQIYVHQNIVLYKMSATPLIGDHRINIITMTLTQRCLILILVHYLRRWPNINTTLGHVYHVVGFSIV